MKNRLFKEAILLLIVPFLMQGCASTSRDISYHDLFPSKKSASAHPGAVAVTRFTDKRPSENDSTIASSFVLLLPLLYYHERQEKPELGDDPENPFSGMSLTEEIPLAISNAMKDRGLFNRVYYARDGKVSGAQWVLEGELIHTRITMRYQGYLLPLTALWWIFGLPGANATIENELTLTLKDAKTDQVVLQRTVTSSIKTPMFYLYTYYSGEQGRDRATYYFAKSLNEATKPFFDEIEGMKSP